MDNSVLLEALKISEELMEREYGGLPIQIGYCNGNNYCLNAVEYHRSSEINIAVEDLKLDHLYIIFPYFYLQLILN